MVNPIGGEAKIPDQPEISKASGQNFDHTVNQHVLEDLSSKTELQTAPDFEKFKHSSEEKASTCTPEVKNVLKLTSSGHTVMANALFGTIKDKH